MSRIRTIKPEFFTSSDITCLTPLARLFYIALWCEADREGRLRWNLSTLKLRYFPADSVDILNIAEELIVGGLIVIYDVENKNYAEIISFKQHQVINNRETSSALPQRVIHRKTELSTEKREVINSESKTASKTLRVSDDALTRESGVQGERKEGREGKGTRVAWFDEFWQAYPKKVGKGDAEKSWNKINPDEQKKDLIFSALELIKNSNEWQKDKGQFIPYPSTWLNGRRWEDEPPEFSEQKPKYKNGDKLPNGLTWFNGRAIS